MAEFPGEVLHGADLHNLGLVHGKRVAIVGDSFSAMELAGELAPPAAALVHIHPRSFWAFSRIVPVDATRPDSASHLYPVTRFYSGDRCTKMRERLFSRWTMRSGHRMCVLHLFAGNRACSAWVYVLPKIKGRSLPYRIHIQAPCAVELSGRSSDVSLAFVARWWWRWKMDVNYYGDWIFRRPAFLQ